MGGLPSCPSPSALEDKGLISALTTKSGLNAHVLDFRGHFQSQSYETFELKRERKILTCIFFLKNQLSTYTVLHIFRLVLFVAGNQINHQNFEKSLLRYKCGLIFIGMKQKKIF